MITGDIILIPFPFTDQSGSKVRPRVIVFKELEDVVVSFITSQLLVPNEFVVQLFPSSINNLRTSSVVVVSKLGTFHQSIVLGKLGSVSQEEFGMIKTAINRMLDAYV